jgi:ferrous iron transport protein A
LNIALSELAEGRSGIVKGLRGGRTFVSRMAGLGFTIGAEVTMVQNLHRGPLVVMVRATRVALGRGEARRVRVEGHPHDS